MFDPCFTFNGIDIGSKIMGIKSWCIFPEISVPHNDEATSYMKNIYCQKLCALFVTMPSMAGLRCTSGREV